MEAVPYWGVPTSSIDWCEKNYVVCSYVAEFWNTITSSFIMWLGIAGMYLTIREKIENRFIVLYAGIIVVGVGSVAFHATLSLSNQLFDELPMMWTTLTWVYIYNTMESPRKGLPSDKVLAKRLAIFGTLWSLAAPWSHFYAPIVFQVIFVALLGYSLINAHTYYKKCLNPTAKTMYIFYNTSLAIGAMIWLTDTHACNKLHEVFGDFWWHKYIGSFHGYWHCLMSMNVYLGPVFAEVIRAQMLDIPYSIQWWLGVVPYVKRENKVLLLSGQKLE